MVERHHAVRLQVTLHIAVPGVDTLLACVEGDGVDVDDGLIHRVVAGMKSLALAVLRQAFSRFFQG